MSNEVVKAEIAHAVGQSLVNVALSTPQGQAAAVGTVALAVAAFPAVTIVAATAGVVYATSKIADWLNF